MKWIRRKPSWPVRGGAVLVCLLFLFTWRGWAGVRSPGFGFTQSNWIEVFYISSSSRGFESQTSGTEVVARSYRTIKRDNRIIVVSLDEAESMELWADPELLSWLYLAGSYQSGFWAPTHWYEVQRMRSPSARGVRGFGSETVLAWYYVQRLRVAMISERGLDPRLIGQVEVADSHIIWTGYLANILSLLAFSLLAWASLWTLAGMPAAIRGRTKRGRLAMGLCPRCTYDLSGTPGSCPECGWVLGDV